MISESIKYVFTREAFKELKNHYLQALVMLWLFVEVPAYYVYRVSKNKGAVFYAVNIAAALWTIARSFPPRHFSKKSRSTNVEVEIKVGNLLEETGNIAFGCSECFDTEPEKVIGAKSLMAQLVNG